MSNPAIYPFQKRPDSPIQLDGGVIDLSAIGNPNVRQALEQMSQGRTRFEQSVVNSQQVLNGWLDNIERRFNADGATAVTIVNKLANETIDTDTVYHDDDTLTFPVAASTKYRFQLKIFYNTPAAADFKWQVTGPTSPTLVIITGFLWDLGSTVAPVLDTAFSVSHAVTTTQTTLVIYVSGILHNGVNAGNVTLQWAQNSSSGVTTVYGGSGLEYVVVA